MVHIVISSVAVPLSQNRIKFQTILKNQNQNWKNCEGKHHGFFRGMERI